jgi:hypothetical protein
MFIWNMLVTKFIFVLWIYLANEFIATSSDNAQLFPSGFNCPVASSISSSFFEREFYIILLIVKVTSSISTLVLGMRQILVWSWMIEMSVTRHHPVHNWFLLLVLTGNSSKLSFSCGILQSIIWHIILWVAQNFHFLYSIVAFVLVLYILYSMNIFVGYGQGNKRGTR